MIRWTGLAPWEFEFPFPGSLTSTFLPGKRHQQASCFRNTVVENSTQNIVLAACSALTPANTSPSSLLLKPSPLSTMQRCNPQPALPACCAQEGDATCLLRTRGRASTTCLLRAMQPTAEAPSAAARPLIWSTVPPFVPEESQDNGMVTGGRGGFENEREFLRL